MASKEEIDEDLDEYFGEGIESLRAYFAREGLPEVAARAKELYDSGQLEKLRDCVREAFQSLQ